MMRYASRALPLLYSSKAEYETVIDNKFISTLWALMKKTKEVDMRCAKNFVLHCVFSKIHICPVMHYENVGLINLNKNAILRQHFVRIVLSR